MKYFFLSNSFVSNKSLFKNFASCYYVSKIKISSVNDSSLCYAERWSFITNINILLVSLTLFWICSSHGSVTSLVVCWLFDILILEYVAQSSNFIAVNHVFLPLVASVECFQLFCLCRRCQLGRSEMCPNAVAFYVCPLREFTFLYSGIALLQIHFNSFSHLFLCSLCSTLVT